MNKLFGRFGRLLDFLADAPEEELDAYQLVAAVGVRALVRIGDELQQLRTVGAATAEALAMLAKAADAQGRAMDRLISEMKEHRETVDALIGELQHMQGDDATESQG